MSLETSSFNLNLTEAYASLATNSSSQILFTFVFLVFWSILYTAVNYAFNFKSLLEKDSNDVKNRIISIVHGVLSFWFACSEYLPYPTFK